MMTTEHDQLPAPPEPKIEALLNQAIRATVHAFEDQKATKAVLEAMGSYARQAVLTQADLGMWREWAINDGRDLAELGCTFEITQRGPLDVQSWVAPSWDFARTPLRFLATWSEARPS